MGQAACAQVIARATDLAALAADKAQAQEPHLASCAACRTEVQRTREVLAGLSAIPLRPLPRDMSTSVMARIASAPAPAWLQKAQTAQTAPRVAASPRAPVAAGPSTGSIPKVAPRKPAPAAEAPGFMAWMSARPVTIPAFALAVALFAFLALKPAPGPGVARRGPVPWKGGTSPSALPAEEGAAEIATGPDVRIAHLTGAASWTDEGKAKPLAANQAIPPGRRIVTQPGAKLTLALSDGTKVDVGAESELLAYSEKVRVRRGVARFEVTHRPERIFRVQLPDAEVRVLGTVFDVDARPGTNRVHLLHGRIEIQTGSNVARLEDGDTATTAGGQLKVVTAAEAASGAGADPLTSGASASHTASDAGPAAGEDPRPTVEATAASGPAPTGLH